MSLLEIRNLKIHYRTKTGIVKAVDDVSFSIERGGTLGLVGESGCGKTTIAKAIMRLLPRNGMIAGGEILFDGRNLVNLSDEEVRKYRWENVAMISQSAMNSLNPVARVGSQLIEAIQAHRQVSVEQATRRMEEVFELVGLSIERARDYPHQFSGGMKQRAVIAMALLLNPELIIADEPTTALDVLVQDQIILKIKELLNKLNNAMILITHDIAVVAETCERMVVMYAGKIMEHADTDDIFYNPYNPYTLGLQNAFPSVKGERKELISIPGYPPLLIDPPPGCRFAERCPFVLDICLDQEPPLEQVAPGHFSACHRAVDIEEIRIKSKDEATWLAKKAA
ncbi:MAG: ABC transporter ATP-binding protein [Deltaproteobacteria bacterium]|nr:ABC transporter ATP-binding protein [Deltaproteobacteria bacterium]